MPWCPGCRSEYRQGIGVCPSCGLPLQGEVPPARARAGIRERVRASWLGSAAAWLSSEPQWDWPPVGPVPGPPAAAEPTGPAPYPWETAARWLSRRWPRWWAGLRAGLRLLPHAFWRTVRLRGVWGVVLLLALVASVSEMRILSAMAQRGPSGRQISWSEYLGDAFDRWHFVRRMDWTTPEMLGENLTEGMGDPLERPFREPWFPVHWSLARFLGWDATRPNTAPLVLLGVLIVVAAALVAAPVQGALWGWLFNAVAAVGSQHRSAWQWARRNFRPLLLWRLCLAMLASIIALLVNLMQARWTSALGPGGLWHVERSTYLIMVMLLALTPFLMVVEEQPLWPSMARGFRIVRARLPMLAGLFVVYRVAAEGSRLVGGLLGDQGQFLAGDIGGARGIGAGLAAVVVTNVVAVLLALSLCTSYMLIVVRTPAEQAVEPAHRPAEQIPTESASVG